MPLTPIKVRGKRNGAAKKNKRVHPYDRSNSSTPTPTLIRRIRPRKKSLLERQLPLEILERIFYLSENLAFPRCSPLLGRLLSGRQTLLGAAVAAFAPTWDAWYGVDQRRLQGFHWKHRLTDAERARCRAIEEGLHPGNPAFQSAILACPWADLPTILEAQSQWARRFAPSRPAPSPLGDDEDTGPLLDADGPTPLYQDVHPHTRIPDPLISGPWSPHQALVLRWLRRGGARFHPSQDWELKLRGLRAAVAAPPPRLDTALVAALCLMGDFFWDREDRTPRLGRATTTTAAREDDDTGITDEWPRAVLAEELDRVDHLRERWRAGGGREPEVLARLAYLMEMGLGEHASSGRNLDLQRLVRR
ncbi:hypothetical protein ACHAQH_003102 [Verticillium albo-atrum]